ncbi:MAG: phage late control D family protein, partial [Planctomycetota bacterium]
EERPFELFLRDARALIDSETVRVARVRPLTRGFETGPERRGPANRPLVGYEVFVERDTFHFHAPRDSLAQIPGALEYRKNLRSFEVRLSIEKQVTKVVVKGWDAENKEPIVAIASGKDTVRTVLGLQAASDFVKEDFGEGAKILHDLVPRTVKEAEELARAYLKRSEYTLLQGSGSVAGDPALKAKTLVEIAGVGTRYSGSYYVTKVSHSIGDSGYVCEFECSRNAVS